MLALDRGGCCRGVAFRLDERQVEEELLILWRREMLSGSYEARWVDAHSQEGPVTGRHLRRQQAPCPFHQSPVG